MADPHSVTSASIDFALRTFGAAPRPVPAELEYDTRDPYAVAVVLHAGSSGATCSPTACSPAAATVTCGSAPVVIPRWSSWS